MPTTILPTSFLCEVGSIGGVAWKPRFPHSGMETHLPVHRHFVGTQPSFLEEFPHRSCQQMTAVETKVETVQVTLEGVLQARLCVSASFHAYDLSKRLTIQTQLCGLLHGATSVRCSTRNVGV